MHVAFGMHMCTTSKQTLQGSATIAASGDQATKQLTVEAAAGPASPGFGCCCCCLRTMSMVSHQLQHQSIVHGMRLHALQWQQ
jgi:hypothetical protein